MARPKKEGLDYYPHDVDMSNDEKIQTLEDLYGVVGYATYNKLLERIYRAPNQELSLKDEDTIKSISKRCFCDAQTLQQIIHTCIKINLFDGQLYKRKKSLSSKGIKRRANVVLEKRIKMRELRERGGFVEHKRDNKRPKVKESKVESKVKERESAAPHSAPSSFSEASVLEATELRPRDKNGQVWMSDPEYENLVEEYGDGLVETLVAEMSDAALRSPSMWEKQKNHAATFRTWLRRKSEEGREYFDKAGLMPGFHKVEVIQKALDERGIDGNRKVI